MGKIFSFQKKVLLESLHLNFSLIKVCKAANIRKSVKYIRDNTPTTLVHLRPKFFHLLDLDDQFKTNANHLPLFHSYNGFTTDVSLNI